MWICFTLNCWRVTEKIYDAENIIICELKNDSNFTFLDFIGFGCENEHIKQVSEDNKTEIENAIIELKKANPNYSLREIANELNTNQMKVKRILKKHEM